MSMGCSPSLLPSGRPASCSLKKFRRRALETTQKLERLMAAAQNMGSISQPNRPENAPAARGMPMML